jgi:hypothetical protein
MLPPSDAQHLQIRAPDHTVTVEAGHLCVLIPNLPMPPGLGVAASDLLLRLSPGYPDIAPDMWWFDPPVKRADGREIPATQAHERHLGREWQRWSRHLQPGQWRSGVDSLESYLAIVRRELEIAGTQAAA